MKKITLFFMLLISGFAFSQENCAEAIDLATLTSPYMGDTTGAVNDFGQDCLTNAGAPDQVFFIVVPAGSTLSIGQTVNSYDSKARLAYGEACPGDVLIDCNDDPDIETLDWLNDTGAEQTVYWTQSAFSTGSGTFTLAWSVVACSSPVATTTLLEDCVNSEFSVTVDVTSLGNAPSLTISNDVGVASTPVTAIGMFTVGPFTAGTEVNITLEHDEDAGCNVALGAFVDNCPQSFDVDCAAGTPVNVNYCYDENEDRQWIFTSTDGSALRIDFVEGYFEDCCDDIIIYDGADIAAPVLFMSDTNFNNDATGISAISTGDTMLVRLTSDGSVSCAAGSGSAIPLDFNVICNTCTPALVTAAVVNDCDVSGGFNIVVDVTDLGSSTSLTLSDDQASATQAVTAIGMYTFGPYANGTAVAITAVSDQDAACTETFTGLTQVACPPANDALCNAQTLVVGDLGVASAYTNVAATTETGEPDGTCFNSGSQKTVWFTFTIAADGDYTVSTDIGGTHNDSEISVYNAAGVTCSDLSTLPAELGCDQDGGTVVGNGWMSILSLTLTAGDYYVQFSGYNNAEGDFGIQVTQNPPANDECANAEALTLGTEITADNTGATDSMVAGDCFTGTISDLWYSFVAGAGLEVEITTTASQYGVYSDCAGTEVVACNTSSVTGLTEGTTYYVRVNDDGTALRSQAPGSFTLTVSEPTAGTDEFNADSLFSYYPNPVSDNLTLKAQKEINNVSVYNMIGQEVYRNQPNTLTNEVNMSSLQAGAYFVKVTISGVTETIKVIKN